MKFRTDVVELHPEEYVTKFPWMAVTLAHYHRLALVAQASLDESQDKSCYRGALMMMMMMILPSRSTTSWTCAKKRQ